MSLNTDNLKPGYFLHRVDANFLTKKIFYLAFMPLRMSNYPKFTWELQQKGIRVDWEVGMLESGKMFGTGWIGMAAGDRGDTRINQEFVAYKLVGDYRQLGSAYRKVMRDYPEVKTFYNLYLTDPNVTAKEENVTYILLA